MKILQTALVVGVVAFASVANATPPQNAFTDDQSRAVNTGRDGIIVQQSSSAEGKNGAKMRIQLGGGEKKGEKNGETGQEAGGLFGSGLWSINEHIVETMCSFSFDKK